MDRFHMDGYPNAPANPETFESLGRLLSVKRFATFLFAADGTSERALRLYAWNIEISSAFWGSFHMLEISLRNALHAQLTELGQQEDWWNAELLLPRDPIRDLLHRDTKNEIQKAISSATKKQTAKGLQTEPGHVVAELNFSFWNGMLANRYQQRLWEVSLTHAFPHYTGRRGILHRDLDRLRMLRNRIAHHEPIFERDLAIDHEKICNMIGYIEPEAKIWVMKNSRIVEILALKEQRLNGQLRSSF